MSGTIKPHQLIRNDENANSNNNNNNTHNNNNKINNHWKLEDLTYFKKCGEITISSDKQRFGLSCVFCNGICFQLDVFKIHIQEEHSQDIKDLYYDSDMKRLYYGQQQQPSISIVNEIDKGNKSNWNEVNTATTTNTTTTTNTMTTLATLLSQVDFELEMENRNDLEIENIQELVYIMDDSNNVLNMEEEEETVEPFQLNGDGGQTTTTIATPPLIPTTTIITEGKGCDIENFKIEDVTVDQESTTQSIFDEESERSLPFIKLDASPKIPTRHAGHDREVITYLLDAYRNNPKLWNPNHPDYKYNAPRNVFNELAVPLERDINVTLSGGEIFEILNGLRSRYRRELTKMKISKKKQKSNLWYFEKMHFLRDVIESKRAERESKNRHKTVNTTNDETITSNKPTKIVQSKEKLIFLLEAYKSREELWNTELNNYSNFNKLSLFKDISNELLKEKNTEMSPTTCKIEIDKLITRYRKELNALHRRKGLHIPKLWCFEQMDFLKKIFEMEFQNRKRRKKGIVTTSSRSSFNRAENIVFEKFEDQLKFIEIYKAYPALWSCEHPDYRSVKYRGEAIKSMMIQFHESFNIKIESEELEKTIFTLRKAFSAEKLKKISPAIDNDDNSESNSSSIKSIATSNMSPQLYAILSTFLSANVGPFRCDSCQMIIKTSDQYKLHKSAHDGTLPFVCVLCSKGFQVSGNLAIHIRRHKRDFPYSCEQCNKSFATSTEVTIHQRVHTGARPYICDLCGKTFKTWSFFDIHRRVHLNQSTFLCPICDKGFYEKNRYTAHMNHHLNIRKHCCKVCGKSFTTYGNLKKHCELHLPERKYKCDTCGMRFAQFASLRWHKRKKHSPNAAYNEDLLEQ